MTRRTGLYLYDGYMVRYHPQWDWIRGMDVGSRKIVNAHFSYPPQPEGNIRNIAAWGGGPIWDIGCYCLLSGMMLFDGTPELVAVHKEQEEHLDVEKTATAIVDFGNGADPAFHRVERQQPAAVGNACRHERLGKTGCALQRIARNNRPLGPS